jgi:hypothetical protein
MDEAAWRRISCNSRAASSIASWAAGPNWATASASVFAASSKDSGSEPIGVITVACPMKMGGRDASSPPSDLTGVRRRTVPTRWSVNTSSR